MSNHEKVLGVLGIILLLYFFFRNKSKPYTFNSMAPSIATSGTGDLPDFNSIAPPAASQGIPSDQLSQDANTSMYDTTDSYGGNPTGGFRAGTAIADASL